VLNRHCCAWCRNGVQFVTVAKHSTYTATHLSQLPAALCLSDTRKATAVLSPSSPKPFASPSEVWNRHVLLRCTDCWIGVTMETEVVDLKTYLVQQCWFLMLTAFVVHVLTATCIIIQFSFFKRTLIFPVWDSTCLEQETFTRYTKINWITTALRP
jgi:hypothetical protein